MNEPSTIKQALGIDEKATILGSLIAWKGKVQNTLKRTHLKRYKAPPIIEKALDMDELSTNKKVYHFNKRDMKHSRKLHFRPYRACVNLMLQME